MDRATFITAVARLSRDPQVTYYAEWFADQVDWANKRRGDSFYSYPLAAVTVRDDGTPSSVTSSANLAAGPAAESPFPRRPDHRVIRGSDLLTPWWMRDTPPPTRTPC